MTLENQLSTRILKQHRIGCRVGIIVNILWAISNYFIISENKLLYVGINLLAATIISITCAYRSNLKLNGEHIGLVAMLTTLSAFAFTYNTIDETSFQHLTYTHAAVFIGAGMFLLWPLKYSIISAIYAILINALFYILFSPIPLEQYVSEGVLLLLSVLIFMIVSIQSRYKLVISNIKAQLSLEKSQIELQTSEEQHRLLFEKNPTPMLICSLENLQILAVNDLVISKYGYTRSEFLQMTILDLHREIDLNDVILHTDNPKEKDTISEWIHLLKNNTEINVELIAKSIAFNRQHARLVSINDITKVKQYQNELIKAKQEAEHSKELQRQFLSNMSHEIRTPMNGIIGITRILQNTNLTDEQNHYLNAVIKSSQNLMVIINDILDFSKIEAGKVIIEKTPMDLHDMLNVIQEILVIQAEKKGIYLTVHLDEDVPTKIIGDPVRLNQILTNLVGNAIKFTDKGGVSIKISKLHSTVNSAKLRFEIKDSGIGIPKDKLAGVFNSFTQASSSTTRTHGGTGLGLTISKQLIELQKGTISIESEFGKGSQFSFELEYDLDKINLDKNEKIQPNDLTNDSMLLELNGIDILLVEDHPINQMLAVKVLSDWGFNVDTAENGLIALDMVSKKDYKLILMDISMPEMDGYETTKEIRSGKHTANSDLPIIAMTASAFIGDNQKCFKAGMNDYITKPFDPKSLLEKIYYQLSPKLKTA